MIFFLPTGDCDRRRDGRHFAGPNGRATAAAAERRRRGGHLDERRRQGVRQQRGAEESQHDRAQGTNVSVAFSSSEPDR